MPQRTVVEIPANPALRDFRKRKQKLRVAAYCRVSTEEEEQQNSFEVQVNYYFVTVRLENRYTPTKTVSYTHLDVYKRQGQSCICIS